MIICTFCENELHENLNTYDLFVCKFCPGISFRAYYDWQKTIDVTYLQYKHLEVRLMHLDKKTIIVDTRREIYDPSFIILELPKLLDINPQNLEEKLSMYLLFM